MLLIFIVQFAKKSLLMLGFSFRSYLYNISQTCASNIRRRQYTAAAAKILSAIKKATRQDLSVIRNCWIKNVILEKTELTEFLSKNEGILLAKY
jgi:hypothetical protein